MLFRIFLVIAVLTSAVESRAQILYDGSFGSGLQLQAKDSTFFVKFTTRIQPNWNFNYNVDDEVLTDRMTVRRARLKFDGYFINQNLRYKIEYDVVGGYVRDAYIKYKFAPKWDLWFGQAKLPGNRERIVSSANLQLVDRSVFNNHFSLDRDLGFQLRNQFKVGNVVIRDIYALSAGNGILDLKSSKGVELTGKIEILPFGLFTKKGDYIGADIYREENLKMSIAFGADYNMSAYKSQGQVGFRTGTEEDLFMIFGDILLKYHGASFMIEVAQRTTPNAPSLVYDDEGVLSGAFYTGWGINLQGGYVFENMWEISGRYSYVEPDNGIYPSKEDFTLGLSKYVFGHNFKVQTDFTYRVEQFATDHIIGRLQMEFQF